MVRCYQLVILEAYDDGDSITVNDRFVTDDTFMIDDEATQEEILNALVNANYLCKANVDKMEVDWWGDFVADVQYKENGFPLYGLELIGSYDESEESNNG